MDMNRDRGDEVRARNSVLVAVGYLPALAVVGGLLYWTLRGILERIFGLTALHVTSQDLAVKGLVRLSTPVIAVGVTWCYLRLADRTRLKDLGLDWRPGSAFVLVIGLTASMVGATTGLMVTSRLGKPPSVAQPLHPSGPCWSRWEPLLRRAGLSN